MADCQSFGGRFKNRPYDIYVPVFLIIPTSYLVLVIYRNL